jgi:biotin-(acetyl-CoA carboxylase) ligase
MPVLLVLKLNGQMIFIMETKSLAGILMENNHTQGKQYVLIGVGVNFTTSRIKCN